MVKTKKLSMSLVSFVLIIVMMFSLVTPAIAHTTETESTEYISPISATYDEASLGQGNIIGEDKSLRDEYTKYFITDTGCTVVAQYPVPVHYMDEYGEYVDYDNSLISSHALNLESTVDEATTDEVSTYGLNSIEAEEDTFSNKKSDSKVSHFKKSGKTKLVEVTRDGYTISWGYSGASVVSAKEKQRNSTEKLTGDDAYLTVSNLSSTVVYENIYNNTDLEVINSTTGVKENLILKNLMQKMFLKLIIISVSY